MNEAITVVKIRALSGESPLKAFVDIRVGDWLITDWRIVKQDNQRAWVSVPQTSWKDSVTGETRYHNLLTIPSELKQRIDVEILHAWDKEFANGKTVR